MTRLHALPALTICLALTAACSPADTPLSTSGILVTSEAGAKLEAMTNVAFGDAPASGPSFTVYPDSLKQVIHGIGSSFTESSAYVLAHLVTERRREVMEKIWGASGADFTLARTHIGACDFSVEGKYSYADETDDVQLSSFTVAEDEAGFDPAAHPGVRESGYDLLPMIREALEIKRTQGGEDLRIVASAWTAPAWMKDIETWYIRSSQENNWQGTGGSLKPEYEAVYADYLVRYLDAYAAKGVDIWGLTPVNEPHGNGGHWESMHFSAESQNEFVKKYLGPRLQDGGHADTQLFVYDQNRGAVEHWADVIFSDPETLPYVAGIAVHWYESTVKVFEDSFDRVHARFPEQAIIHTEGCIDDLGKDAPGGIGDPEGFTESGWFANDEFWWNRNATDWAYTAEWAGPGSADHPMYTPVHRYARNIIVSLDHWVSGWIDWNIVLDRDGGPNHVGNFCGAPIMIDTATQEVHYTPIYWVLAQFSRTIRPGDRAVRTERELAGLDADALHACATINKDGLLSVQVLNTTKAAIAYTLRIGERTAEITVPANAVQTVRIGL